MKNRLTTVPIGCGTHVLMNWRKPGFASTSVPSSSSAAAATARSGSSSGGNQGIGLASGDELAGVGNRRPWVSAACVSPNDVNQSIEAVYGEAADDDRGARTAELFA
jgi:hypothetical protein